MPFRLTLDAEKKLKEFCSRWKIQELSFFGSALRADFDAESDIDVMVDFRQDADWGLLDHVQMQQELEAILGRKVDLITKRALRYSSNEALKEKISSTAEIVLREDEIPYG